MFIKFLKISKLTIPANSHRAISFPRCHCPRRRPRWWPRSTSTPWCSWRQRTSSSAPRERNCSTAVVHFHWSLSQGPKVMFPPPFFFLGYFPSSSPFHSLQIGAFWSWEKEQGTRRKKGVFGTRGGGERWTWFVVVVHVSYISFCPLFCILRGAWKERKML